MLQVLERGASLWLSLFLDSVVQPSACHRPLVWGHFQADWYELPDVLRETSGVCLLSTVFNVLVEVVATCFPRREDKASCGQQRVLTETAGASHGTEGQVLALRRR